MLTWLIQNIGTIIVASAVLAITSFILLKLRANKKKGKSSCGCSCSSCPMGGSCHK